MDVYLNDYLFYHVCRSRGFINALLQLERLFKAGTAYFFQKLSPLYVLLFKKGFCESTSNGFTNVLIVTTYWCSGFYVRILCLAQSATPSTRLQWCPVLFPDPAFWRVFQSRPETMRVFLSALGTYFGCVGTEIASTFSEWENLARIPTHIIFTIRF